MLGFSLRDTYHDGIGIGIINLFQYIQDIVSPFSLVFIYYYSLVEAGSTSDCIIGFLFYYFFLTISCFLLISPPCDHTFIYIRTEPTVLYTCIACACSRLFFLLFFRLVLCISIGRIGLIIFILVIILILNEDIVFLMSLVKITIYS